MDLTKIRIKSLRADKARDLIDALEELPSETIQYPNHLKGTIDRVEAYRIAGVNELSILCKDEKEVRLIKFNVPKNSKKIKRSDYKAEFEYNGKSYVLRKESFFMF